jgi:hypothetical protein
MKPTNLGRKRRRMGNAAGVTPVKPKNGSNIDVRHGNVDTLNGTPRQSRTPPFPIIRKESV